MTAADDQHPNPWRHSPPLRIAHQGGELEAPSSTLFALKRAVAMGCDVLELDVHAAADGTLMVLHDPTVDRTTDGGGRVDELTVAQLQGLDAAYWFAPGRGITRDAAEYPLRGIATGAAAAPAGFAAADFTIPTLADVFAAFPQTRINLDIKATAPDTAPYEAVLADLVAAFGRRDRTMIASFSDAALAAYRAIDPAAWTSAGPAEVQVFWTAVAGGAAPPTAAYRALQVPLTFGDIRVVTPPFVAAAHDGDLAVHVWTIDDDEAMRLLIDMGVDGIVTNRPTVLLGLLPD